MKRITFLFMMVLFVAFQGKIQAQEDLKMECTKMYNLFLPDYKAKNYDAAYTNWIWLMDNCPDLSVNIYKYGSTIAEDVKKDPALVKRVYEQRLKYYPDDSPAKVHSDYAYYLDTNKLATDDEIFAILEKAYKIDPKEMNVISIFKYFQIVTDRNKDTNPQLVFDTYDGVIESVGEKLDDYARKINELTKDSTRVLTSSEKGRLRAYQINSQALGQIEIGLDQIITEIATCERLVPLYERDFPANKDNATWLRRAVSRLYNKDCQDVPLYATLAKAYAEAAPSADSYSFYAQILENNGDKAGATAMRQKAFDLETDPLSKAKYKLKFADNARKAGQYSTARALAREALSYNPNFGNAYLLIARLYQASANDCGKTEFEKRMVYAAALRMAQKAASVDPSISDVANRYISSYRANLPSKQVLFTAGRKSGESYTIGCWIGETVTIP